MITAYGRQESGAATSIAGGIKRAGCETIPEERTARCGQSER